MECELQSVTIDMQKIFLTALTKDGVIDESNLILENIELNYGSLKKRVSICVSRQEKLIENIQVSV